MMAIIPAVMIGDICHKIDHSFMLNYEIFSFLLCITLLPSFGITESSFYLLGQEEIT